MLTPILEKVCKAEGIRLVKVNIDNCQKTAEKYMISSLPTVSLFNEGKVVKSFVGSRNEEFVKKFIQQN